MTCIIGLESNNKVYIGGDSAGTSQDMSQRIRGDKKVFIRDGYIIGFCGSFRMGQIMQHKLVLPQQAKKNDVVTFMVNEFINSLKECLKGEENLTPNILVGYKCKLFTIMGDYQVGETVTGFDAMGSGADIAMGAMHMNVFKKEPERRIEEALKASALNNAAVRPPFTILNV